MKVYISKYALTIGIQEVDAEQSKASPRMISYGEGVGRNYVHGEGVEWHRTFDEAKNRAEEMRRKRIASLKASIAKLEKLTW